MYVMHIAVIESENGKFALNEVQKTISHYIDNYGEKHNWYNIPLAISENEEIYANPLMSNRLKNGIFPKNLQELEEKISELICDNEFNLWKEEKKRGLFTENGITHLKNYDNSGFKKWAVVAFIHR